MMILKEKDAKPLMGLQQKREKKDDWETTKY
jgi:hypothetical protein